MWSFTGSSGSRKDGGSRSSTMAFLEFPSKIECGVGGRHSGTSPSGQWPRVSKVVTGMRRREIWFAALLSSLTAVGCTKISAKTEKADKADLPVVLVGRPAVQEVTNYEEFIGHTDAIFSVEVRARVSGYLDKVNFNDGDEVEKGTLLFEIAARPYKTELERADAILRQGEARLTRLAADHRRADALFKKGAIGLEEFDRINGDFAEGQ